jgi:quercetin dioxygenase-like cupin family protein
MEPIAHRDALPRYSPPGHAGTVNVRLVDRSFCGAFEMIHGTIAPGGEAERHAHESEHQVIYLLEGEAAVELGGAPAVRCGPGAVIRIPPRLDHRVVNVGAAPLKLIVLYSPPLPPRNDQALP